MFWLRPGSGSPESRRMTVSVVMLAPIPTLMARIINMVSTLLRPVLCRATFRE